MGCIRLAEGSVEDSCRVVLGQFDVRHVPVGDSGDLGAGLLQQACLGGGHRAGADDQRGPTLQRKKDREGLHRFSAGAPEAPS